jgi:hypothetical protein
LKVLPMCYCISPIISLTYLNGIVVLYRFCDGQAPLEGQYDGGKDGGHDGDALKLKIRFSFQTTSQFRETAVTPNLIVESGSNRSSVL